MKIVHNDERDILVYLTTIIDKDDNEFIEIYCDTNTLMKLNNNSQFYRILLPAISHRKIYFIISKKDITNIGFIKNNKINTDECINNMKSYKNIHFIFDNNMTIVEEERVSQTDIKDRKNIASVINDSKKVVKKLDIGNRYHVN